MEQTRTDTHPSRRWVLALGPREYPSRPLLRRWFIPRVCSMTRRRLCSIPWFTDQEKRAVLLSWVRDELVIEQVVQKAAPSWSWPRASTP